MLSNHSGSTRDEPATSPALTRRRDLMLGHEANRHNEPRLIPESETQSSFLPEESLDAGDDESDPDIPPTPTSARPLRPETGLEPAEAAAGRPRLWAMATAVVAVGALGAVTWIAYDSLMTQPDGAAVPYVTAEVGPEKIRPQEEGGMEVPNQDIRVYNELNGAPPAPETEILLPEPEAPVAPPAVAANEPPAANDASAIPSVPAPPLEVQPAAGTDDEPAAAETSKVATAEGTTMEPPAKVAEATSPPTQVAATSGAFRIQLAAVKSRDAAQAAWKKMAKAHSDVLSGLALKVVKVDRGGDAALYRVQGGPFADRAAAESACGKLKQKSQDCLVVAP